MKGKAAVFTEPGKPFQIRELPVPEVESGGILIKITSAAICGSDLHFWRGDHPPPNVQFGTEVLIGHEMTGVVHSLGAGVTTDSLGRPLKEGDRVAYSFTYPCLRCYWCIRGEFNHCPHRARYRVALKDYPYCSAAYAEYYYLQPGHFVFLVPDELPEEMVTPVNCAVSQVIQGLNVANLHFGDTVVVQGAGGLGLNACAVAKDRGCNTVIAIDGITSRLELARQCGADETIDITELQKPEERIARVMEITEGRGADAVLEVVGIPEVVPEGLAMLRRGGTYVEIGNISAGHMISIDVTRVVTHRGIHIVGVGGYDPWVIPVAMDFLIRARGRFALDRVVSHKYPLEEITRAFQDAEWMGGQKDSRLTRAILIP
ncbi:zinc-binding dehydrogenase [Chloroflexota bacterium]